MLYSVKFALQQKPQRSWHLKDKIRLSVHDRFKRSIDPQLICIKKYRWDDLKVCRPADLYRLIGFVEKRIFGQNIVELIRQIIRGGYREEGIVAVENDRRIATLLDEIADTLRTQGELQYLRAVAPHIIRTADAAVEIFSMWMIIQVDKDRRILIDEWLHLT